MVYVSVNLVVRKYTAGAKADFDRLGPTWADFGPTSKSAVSLTG